MRAIGMRQCAALVTRIGDDEFALHDDGALEDTCEGVRVRRATTEGGRTILVGDARDGRRVRRGRRAQHAELIAGIGDTENAGSLWCIADGTGAVRTLCEAVDSLAAVE